MRAFLAIFLVLMIGNPLCCCAFARTQGCCEAEAVELSPCCQARLEVSPTGHVPEGEESPGKSCPCTAKVGIVAADKVVPPPHSQVKWIPEIPVQTDYAGLDAHELDFRGGASSVPAFLTVTPPPPRLLYGVFRC